MTKTVCKFREIYIWFFFIYEDIILLEENSTLMKGW